MTPESQNKRLSILKDRADMLRKTRSFFADKNIMEVDCPALCRTASVDAHIDLFQVPIQPNGIRYLHSSPEYGMKRLLSENSQDIYQLSHVYREGEWGRFHNPEFMMIEWYRQFSFEQMIEETLELIQLFLGSLPNRTYTYQEAFELFAGIDPFNISIKDLQKIAPKEWQNCCNKDDLLNVILGITIEPQLGIEELSIIIHFPASQAALSKTTIDKGIHVAKRFEVFANGMELANGYEELTNPQEQKIRFETSNERRTEMGKEPLPIDNSLLEALMHGLPDCCGVAVGFDRLMMLRHHAQDIKEILSFGWSEA